jgi:hypothetical protein
LRLKNVFHFKTCHSELIHSIGCAKNVEIKSIYIVKIPMATQQMIKNEFQ